MSTVLRKPCMYVYTYVYVYISELLLFSEGTLIHAFNGIGSVSIITRLLSQPNMHIFIYLKKLYAFTIQRYVFRPRRSKWYNI